MKPWVVPALIIIALGIAWLLFRDRGQEEYQPAVTDGKLRRLEITTFEDPQPVDLTVLLQRSRQELATLNRDYEEKIAGLEKLRHDGNLVQHFLPLFRTPLCWPIWHECKYSSKLDMLLPPYLEEGKTDAGLALHLARHGDLEAARKLADPADTALKADIAALALSRNYPAEWTRLIALMLDHAHLVLANGTSYDPARRIASLHRQLSALLDDADRKSPIGVALLPRGRIILTEAIDGWRKIGYADWLQHAEPALKDWGKDAAPVLPAAQTRDVFARLVGSQPRGLLVAANPSQRGRDVLGLPLPGKDVQSVAGLFNPAGALQEIVVAYKTELIDITETRHLTFRWEEQVEPKAKAAYTPEVLLPHASFLGPIVRVVASSRDAQTPPLGRDFGPVSLDRGFEHNRRMSAWSESGQQASGSNPKMLAELKNPLIEQEVTQVQLAKAGKEDMTASLTLNYGPTARPGLVELAAPLWEAFGAGQLEVTGTSSKDSVDLSWQDGKTIYRLRLPHHKKENVTLEVRDQQTLDTARLAKIRARDEADRRERMKSNTPVKRVPRSLGLFTLGMTAADLERKLASTQAVRKQIEGALLLTFLETDIDDDPYHLRQAVARFEDGKLVETRLRYADAPGKKPGAAKAILENLKKPCGAPELIADETETTGKKSPKKDKQAMLWHDDTTLLLGRIDQQSVEVILKDCPLDHSRGRPLPPLAWLPRGPQLCVLGTTKNDLFKAWNLQIPNTLGDAVLLNPPAASPFDAYLVWFEDDRVSKVVARHKMPTDLTDLGQASRAILEAWTEDAQNLGWPGLQDGVKGVTRSIGNRDDQTQFRIFWGNDDGLRIFSEWK